MIHLWCISPCRKTFKMSQKNEVTLIHVTLVCSFSTSFFFFPNILILSTFFHCKWYVLQLNSEETSWRFSLLQGNNEQTLPGKSRRHWTVSGAQGFSRSSYALRYVIKQTQTPTQTQTPYRKRTLEQQKHNTCKAHFNCRNYCTGDRTGGRAQEGAEQLLRTDAVHK